MHGPFVLIKLLLVWISDRTRGDGLRFRLATRRSILTERNSLPRAVVESPSMEVLKRGRYMVLSDMV